MTQSGDSGQAKAAVGEMIAKGLYVFGGHHTQQTLVNLQKVPLEGEFKDIINRPSIWWSWPALVVGLPKKFKYYVKGLDVCSEFDNEPIALPPSFRDRVIKLRNRWCEKFGTVKAYQKAKAKGEVKAWSKDMAMSIGIAASAGTIGQFIAIVAQDDEIWQKMKRLLTGDYLTPRKDRKGQKIKGKPIESTTHVFNLAGTRADRLSKVLDDVLNGTITLQEVSDLCKDVKKHLRCRTYICNAFAQLGAIDPETGLPPSYKWLQAHMSVDKTLMKPYVNHFSQSNQLMTKNKKEVVGLRKTFDDLCANFMGKLSGSSRKSSFRLCGGERVAEGRTRQA